MKDAFQKESKPYFSIGLLLVVLSIAVILYGGVVWFAILKNNTQQASLLASKPGFFSVGPVLPVLMGAALMFLVSGIWLRTLKGQVEDVPEEEREAKETKKPGAVPDLDMTIPVCAYLGAFLFWAFIWGGAIGVFLGGFIGAIVGQLIQWIVSLVKKPAEIKKGTEGK